jgi:starch synthase (maltosyl-transferring)
VVAGRIEIDDVAPVVSGGRFPAKAVVGEIIPVRASVWREGHDAVSATLVVRYHGTRTKLADDPPGRVRRRSPCRSGCAMPPARQTNQVPSAAEHPRVFHGQFSPSSWVVDHRVDGWGDPIATWRKHVTAKLARARASLRPTTSSSAPGYWRR